LKDPSRSIVAFPYDELRLPWEFCAVFKKKILKQELNSQEEEILRKWNWDRKFESNCVSRDEEVLWRNEVAKIELKKLHDFFHASIETEINILRERAYVRIGIESVLKDKNYMFKAGDIVIFEGKFTNHNMFKEFVDLSIAIRCDLDEILKRYSANRSEFLSSEQMAELIKYYVRLSIPSWYKYINTNIGRVDYVVNS